ncbi:polyphosphate kinase [Pseudorhodobacter antarcticus]|jgi:polyphosphate kinase|uniref:Polyphosphate kinase n=1 Tax=Pseudorhodobacter antarcticus TaxID=1077947 RepID=A0A1H8N7Q2_9RHOB|nr:DUF1007 family protein [Pseudorhodobacter antarcticus]SEO25518.1 polyphosphate kinase [Pseudorhodobacter antarcticus]
MTFWQRLVLGGALGLGMGVQTAAAHPHIFIDTALEAIFDDQGRVTALRISWSYDDFYSLLTVQDMGLDPDGDGALAADEVAQLSGFDMNWDADYDGDLYVLHGGQAIAMGRPQDPDVRYDNGIITSIHLRTLAQPVAPGLDGLVVQVYDSGFYTAYSILPAVALTAAPAGCMAEVFEPDLSEADAALQAVLLEYSPGDDVEMEFPAVGANYADEARVTCPAP